MPTQPTTSTPDEERNREFARYKREIRDAQMLLDFALSQSGAVRDAPLVVSDTLLAAIKEAEGQLLLDQLPKNDERTKFEIA